MKGKLIYWFIIGPLIFLGIALWIWTEGEATGTVRTGTVEEKKEEIKKEAYLYEGTHVSFLVPGDFHEVSHNLPESGPLKESVYFSLGESATTKKIALTLEQREELAFVASPSYQMRQSNPLYTEAAIPEEQVVWLEKKTEGYELAYFFFWEGYLGTLTYTAGQENNEAKDILQGIKKSFEKVEVSEGQGGLKSLQ